jgi:hypothetical protein
LGSINVSNAIDGEANTTKVKADAAPIRTLRYIIRYLLGADRYGPWDSD